MGVDTNGHDSKFRGYSYGLCPGCGAKSAYALGTTTGEVVSRCRNGCGWSQLDGDGANALITWQFYKIGDLRIA